MIFMFDNCRAMTQRLAFPVFLFVAVAGGALAACYGAPGAAAQDAGPEPAPGPSASVDDGAAPVEVGPCTSGRIVEEAFEEEDGEREREGDDGMAPGRACIACHAREDGPEFAVAGTVYPTLHEPDDCAGAPASTGGGVVVEVTDGTGQTTTIPVTKNGNFFIKRKKFLPAGAYTVAVVDGRGRRAMTTKLTGAADCNGCHTAAGTEGAPGRIQLPN